MNYFKSFMFGWTKKITVAGNLLNTVMHFHNASVKHPQLNKHMGANLVWFMWCSQGTSHVWHINSFHYVELTHLGVSLWTWLFSLADEIYWKSFGRWCLPPSSWKVQLLLIMLWDILRQCPLSVYIISLHRPYYNRLHVPLSRKYETCGLSPLS